MSSFDFTPLFPHISLCRHMLKWNALYKGKPPMQMSHRASTILREKKGFQARYIYASVASLRLLPIASDWHYCGITFKETKTNPAASCGGALPCQCSMTTEAWLMAPATACNVFHHLEEPQWGGVACIIRQCEAKSEVKSITAITSSIVFWFLSEPTENKMGHPACLSDVASGQTLWLSID